MTTETHSVTVTTKFGYATFKWNGNDYAVKLSSAGNVLWKRFTSRVRFPNRPIRPTSWRRADSFGGDDSKFRAGLDACIAHLQSEG